MFHDMGTKSSWKEFEPHVYIIAAALGGLALVGFLGLKLFAKMLVSDKQDLQTAKSESVTAIARRPADYSLSMTCQVW